jgi:hypothetical protein
MSTIMTFALMVAGPLLLTVFVVGVVALVGLVGYDVATSRARVPALSPAQVADAATSRTEDHAVTRIYMERGVARTFVMVGGVFWGICLAAVLVWFQPGMEKLLYISLLPFLMNVACLIIGWNWERSASIMLVAAAGLSTWWGLANGFELNLLIMLLVGPMLTAAVLFWMARTGETKLALQLTPAPALVPVEIDR